MKAKSILAVILTISLLIGLCGCQKAEPTQSAGLVLWAEPSGIKYMQDDDGEK